MTKIETLREPLIGGMNTNYFSERNGMTTLVRVPHENHDLFENIIYEYQFIGFTGDGGRVNRRNPQEQYKFSRKAAQEGLFVLPPMGINNKVIMYPYLDNAMTLDQYCKQPEINKTLLTYTIFSDLQRAHSLGFIYGDRWAGNMLVDPYFGFTHIDFDLEITGQNARELDTAQVAYHLLWSGGTEIIPTAAKMLSRRDELDHAKLHKYMRGLASFLNSTKVGGVINETEAFVQAIEISNKHTKQLW